MCEGRYLRQAVNDSHGQVSKKSRTALHKRGPQAKPEGSREFALSFSKKSLGQI